MLVDICNVCQKALATHGPMCERCYINKSSCKSYRCKGCKHYVKFLKCNTMHTICANRGSHFEKDTV